MPLSDYLNIIISLAHVWTAFDYISFACRDSRGIASSVNQVDACSRASVTTLACSVCVPAVASCHCIVLAVWMYSLASLSLPENTWFLPKGKYRYGSVWYVPCCCFFRRGFRCKDWCVFRLVCATFSATWTATFPTTLSDTSADTLTDTDTDTFTYTFGDTSSDTHGDTFGDIFSTTFSYHVRHLFHPLFHTFFIPWRDGKLLALKERFSVNARLIKC